MVKRNKHARQKRAVIRAQDKRALVQKRARLMGAKQKNAGNKGISQKNTVLKNAG